MTCLQREFIWENCNVSIAADEREAENTLLPSAHKTQRQCNYNQTVKISLFGNALHSCPQLFRYRHAQSSACKGKLVTIFGLLLYGPVANPIPIIKKKKSNYLFLKLCEKMAINEFSYQLLAYWLELTSPLRFLN